MEAGHFDTARAARLNNPGRIEELRPVQLLKEAAGITRGMTCVDLGSGTGVFTLPMADMVGEEGLVYGVDSSPEMIEYLRARASLPNLKLVQADVIRTGLESGTADFCLLAFILHEVQDPERLLAETHRILKPGGKLAIVEWRMDIDHGPPRDVRISREAVDRLFNRVGLAFGTYVDWSANHYVITGKKPMRTTEIGSRKDFS